MAEDTGGDSVNSAYISGALMGARDLSYVRGLYDAFASACEDAGYSPYVPHRDTDPQLNPTVSEKDVLHKDLGALKGADVVVAYLGEPSLGVGAEIAIAMEQSKTILGLYESRRKVSRFVLGLLADYDKAHVNEFDSVFTACAWIANTLRDQRADSGGHQFAD